MPFISPRPYADCQRLFADECRRLAEEAFGRYCQNLYVPLYLAGRKADGLDTLNPRAAIWTSLEIGTETDYDLQTVAPEPLPRHLTVDQLAAHVRGLLQREPLWIFAD